MLVTTWKVPTGWLEVREALVMGPRRGEDEVTPHTRPPTDFDGEHLLVRTARCLSGIVQVELVCEPVFDYGRSPAAWTLEDERRSAVAEAGGQRIRLRTDLPLGIEGDAARARRVLPAATRCSARCPGRRSWPCRSTSPPREEKLATTTRFWRTWMDSTRFPDHRWRGPIQRSALAIKGLTYMPTGATVAALTTSLPETPGGERNWDYRYTWMRDTTFTLQALHWLQLDWEADEFMQFVADLEPNADGSLQIMYGIDGRRDLTESTRDELTGYAGAHPVRIGNGAFDQRQNDVYGAVLDSILVHTKHSQRLPRRLWPIVESQAAGAMAAWREPDQGIWEARGEPRHYVSSKLMGWVALDRAAKLAEIRGAPDRRRRGAPRPRRCAPTSSSTASQTAVSCASTTRPTRSTPPRCWRRCSASSRATTRGCARPSTRSREDLTDDGFVLRYRTDETDDGLSGREGSFLICSFWLVSALAIVGEMQRARDLMERLLRVASPLGLYAEEFDAATGRHLGNFPQAFSHLALIEAAGRIILAERVKEF